MPEYYGKQDVQREQLKQKLLRMQDWFENLPGNFVSNVGSAVAGTIATPFVLASEFNPYNVGKFYTQFGKGVITGKKEDLPKEVPGETIVRGLYDSLKERYSDPIKTLEQDPFSIVFDAASIALPALRGKAPTTPLASELSGVMSPVKKFFGRKIIEKLGKPASTEAGRLFEDVLGPIGPSQKDILREALRRNMDLIWPQTVENAPSPSFFSWQKWFNPEGAVLYGKDIPAKNLRQIGVTREAAQNLVPFVSDPTDLNISPRQIVKLGREKGVNAAAIAKDVANSRTAQLWDYVTGEKENLVKQIENVEFTRGNKRIKGPILLTETQKTLRELKNTLDVLENSTIKNPLATEGDKLVINNLKGLMKDPVGDIRTLDNTRMGINGLINYAKKQKIETGAIKNLTDLYENINDDIDNSLSQSSGYLFGYDPQLGNNFKIWRENSRELLKQTNTPGYEFFSKETWQGTNPREIMRDPEKGIAKVMSSFNNFEKSSRFLGKENSRNLVLTDMFNKTLDVETHGFKANLIEKYIKEHNDKIKLVFDSDQKHALGVWHGLVKLQNKMNNIEIAQRPFHTKEDQGITNVAAGTFAGIFGTPRPGLIAIGATREGKLIFTRNFLSKIATDKDAAYAAARLAETPLSSPSLVSRTKTFLKAVGKLNLIAQFQGSDGSSQQVTITQDGGIEPLIEKDEKYTKASQWLK